MAGCRAWGSACWGEGWASGLGWITVHSQTQKESGASLGLLRDPRVASEPRASLALQANSWDARERRAGGSPGAPESNTQGPERGGQRRSAPSESAERLPLQAPVRLGRGALPLEEVMKTHGAGGGGRATSNHIKGQMVKSKPSIRPGVPFPSQTGRCSPSLLTPRCAQMCTRLPLNPGSALDRSARCFPTELSTLEIFPHQLHGALNPGCPQLARRTNQGAT